MISVAALRRISDWLTYRGVYNCRIQFDGKTYRINGSIGFTEVTESDLLYPLYDAPEWLIEIIRAEARAP